MAIKFKIKKGDEVIVLAGKDKGKKGTILKMIPDELRVVVSGVNKVKRHTKAGRDGAGGIIEKEASLHVSNVSLVDKKTGKATRVGYKILNDGTKVRIAKRSGETING
ncbi:MAG: 50S ribosomal protein L24 [Alphaproteobacteria bacterium]|nr:50S ribosomal protein L24 [Alphaproteobacteria bacterium]